MRAWFQEHKNTAHMVGANGCSTGTMPYLSTCTLALSFMPLRLCKCVLFHYCVSLHKNSTTSRVRQMLYCRAQQLLKWRASIWGPVLQLAATAEPGQSILVRTIALEWERWHMGRALWNKIWQWTALLLTPKGRWHCRWEAEEGSGHKVLLLLPLLTHTGNEVSVLALNSKCRGCLTTHPLLLRAANGSRKTGWSEGESRASWWQASSWSVLAFVR